MLVKGFKSSPTPCQSSADHRLRSDEAKSALMEVEEIGGGFG